MVHYTQNLYGKGTLVVRARPTNVRSVLTRVVLAAALPVWLASALLLYKVQADGHALIERDAGATARALMVAVDRDLASAEAAALVLAESPYLLSNDLGAFYAQANAILRSNIGNNFVLTDASGQQVLNTLRPYGEPLPRHGDPDLLQRVFATGRTATSDLYIGGVRRRPVVSVDVPVFRGRKVIFDLSLGFFPERLGEILRQEQLPEGWVASIFDRMGVIVARTHAADQFVGQKGASALVDKIAQSSEGRVETRTLEGIAVSAVFSRSRLSNWAVAIGVPTAELTTRLWASFALSISGTVALLALSLVAAHFAGKRLTRPIQALAALALAHGHGERVDMSSLELQEADDVVRALAEGSRLLEDRTAERDLAERRRQQVLIGKQLAEEAARTRSAYFAYLSHELRAPLMAVLVCSDLIARRTRATSLDQKLLEHCERINKGVHHLTSVIDEILDYAKFEARELELHKEPLDVAAEVRGVVDLLEGGAEQAGVELRHDIAPDLPLLYADQTRLRQILLNLLSNALKFTPAGGTVTITAAHAEDAQLVIRIEDTGIGIAPDDLPRVTEPFAQVRDAQSKKHKGTGLGLPLTKGLVELHGGSFTIGSVLDSGTTVTVRLPMSSEVAGQIRTGR
jgi:two-component system, sensor histidine kinase and response regulator